MKQCKQCGKLFNARQEKSILCDTCIANNDEELKHLCREKINIGYDYKTFFLDDIVYKNYFVPLLLKNKINQSAAIRRLIEYAVLNPDVLIDKKSLSTIDKFIDYFVKNIDAPITKTDLRATKFINGNKFKNFWNKNIDEIIQKVNLQGYKLYEVKGYKNSVSYIVMKNGKRFEDCKQ